MGLTKLELALTLTSAAALKVGVISDMHTNLSYDQLADVPGHCWAVSGPTASEPSPWARYGCDPSPDLVDAMLRRFKEKFGTPDVLLVTGDNVTHGISLTRDQATAQSYELVKENITATNEIVKKYFSDTTVVTILGNNDS